MVAEGRWVLKGGFALDLRLDTRARSTKDVDIEWRAAEGELMDALLDAAAEESGDFFAFTIERTGAPEDRLGGSHRFRVSASLAGRPFETFFLDVGFRGDGPLGSEPLLTEELVGFAGSIRSRSRPYRWSSSSPKSSMPTPGSTRVDATAPGSRTWSIWS